jgi:hypothetical protein
MYIVVMMVTSAVLTVTNFVVKRLVMTLNVLMATYTSVDEGDVLAAVWGEVLVLINATSV